MIAEVIVIVFIFVAIMAFTITFSEDAACYCGMYHRTKLQAAKLNTEPLAFRLSFHTKKKGDYIKVYGDQNTVLHEGEVLSSDLGPGNEYHFDLKQTTEHTTSNFKRVELYRGGLLRAVAKV